MVDVIDARIESLKKEIANFEVRCECFLSGVAAFYRFQDKTLIIGL